MSIKREGGKFRRWFQITCHRVGVRCITHNGHLPLCAVSLSKDPNWSPASMTGSSGRTVSSSVLLQQPCTGWKSDEKHGSLCSTRVRNHTKTQSSFGNAPCALHDSRSDPRRWLWSICSQLEGDLCRLLFVDNSFLFSFYIMFLPQFFSLYHHWQSSICKRLKGKKA